jgi:tripartite-type tricarboxylate transporter receptor subunit TctC
LQFFSSGDPHIERIFRAHYLSPALSEHKRQKLQEKLEKAPQSSAVAEVR